jgi:C4-dicarboxylate transporter DctM subunit
MLVAVTFGVFFFLVIAGLPISFSLALGAIVPLIVFKDMTMAVVIQKFFASTNSYGLMAIPFFMIAGGLLDKGGVSRRLVNLANAMVGWLPGGLAVVVFLASAFFGAISGSAIATVGAIGSIMLPAMKEEGYDLRFTLSTIASAGYLGVIVPPSIPMVLYGLSTGTSVGDVFLGGFFPGFLLAGGMGIYSIIYGIKHKEIKRRAFSMAELGKAFIGSIWALIMPAIVLGGIYGGVFTPTEAAAVAVAYGLFIGIFVYRELDLKSIFRIMRSSVITSAMMMFVCAAASCFAYVLALESVPTQIANFMVAICSSQFQFWAMVTVFLLIVGMVMDVPPAILILSPLLTPVAVRFGIDPVTFGVIMIINLGIGMVTPPVGMNVFVAAGLAKTKASEVINRHLLTYMLCSFVMMILLMIFPQIILYLPQLGK